MSDPRRLVVAIALIAGACATQARRDVRPRLDAFMTDLHIRGLFSGAVVVGDERGIVWERGFGFANFEQQARFTPSTPADSGSLAKTFTAALVIALDREGLLRLDDPVQRLLPELPYETITLRHLLSHSSGIPVLDYDFFDRDLPRPAIRTTEALLRVIASRKPPLAFQPGSAFEYSSFGYDLAALAAARAAGKSYGELLDSATSVPSDSNRRSSGRAVSATSPACAPSDIERPMARPPCTMCSISKPFTAGLQHLYLRARPAREAFDRVCLEQHHGDVGAARAGSRPAPHSGRTASAAASETSDRAGSPRPACLGERALAG